jgi:hypothetical protein
VKLLATAACSAAFVERCWRLVRLRRRKFLDGALAVEPALEPRASVGLRSFGGPWLWRLREEPLRPAMQNLKVLQEKIDVGKTAVYICIS